MATQSYTPCIIQPRKAVQSLTAYIPPLEGRRSKIRLDFNENTMGFPQAYEGFSAEEIATYPEYGEFLKKLAGFFNVPEDYLLLTDGSDEALSVLTNTFIEKGVDRAVICTPTFPLISHYLKLAEALIEEIPVTDALTFDFEAIEAALAQKPKLAVFASPDNPTGATVSPEQVAQWCQRYPDTLFVLDEAYYEFCGITVLPMTQQYPNLLVTRTFSKAWALAGLRLGVIAGHPQLIEYIRRVRSPYSVNTLSVKLACNLLDESEQVFTAAQNTMQLKASIQESLQDRGYQVFSGPSNFFLMALGIDAKPFQDFCEAQGILVRDRSGLPKMNGLLRVSMGSKDEMQVFLACVDAFKHRRALIFDLDDTLVDTSGSFDAMVAELVKNNSTQPLQPGELKALRAQGGFNDDWDATLELLKRRGVTMTYADIAQQGRQIYMDLARQTERLTLPESLLERMKARYRLWIVTGRHRDEYEPLWQTTLEGSSLFEGVICQDEVPGLAKKPSPDGLNLCKQRGQILDGYYIGNSVDDMRAAKAAGLKTIGLTSTHDAELLKQAGAEQIIDSLAELETLLRI